MKSSDVEPSNTNIPNSNAAIPNPTSEDANQVGKPFFTRVLIGVPQITAMNSASKIGVKTFADNLAPAIMIARDAIISRESLTLSVDKLLEVRCLSIQSPLAGQLYLVEELHIQTEKYLLLRLA